MWRTSASYASVCVCQPGWPLPACRACASCHRGVQAAAREPGLLAHALDQRLVEDRPRLAGALRQRLGEALRQRVCLAAELPREGEGGSMLLSGGLAQAALHAEPGGEPTVDTRYEARRHSSIVVPIARRVPSGILSVVTSGRALPRLRRLGVTVRKTIDVMIGTYCSSRQLSSTRSAITCTSRCRSGAANATVGGRTHALVVNRFRKLLILWKEKPQNYLALVRFAAALIVWHLVDGLYASRPVADAADRIDSATSSPSPRRCSSRAYLCESTFEEHIHISRTPGLPP